MNYKFGIVGLGLIADFHGQAIEAMDGAEISACMDLDEKRVNDFSTKFACRGYTSIEASCSGKAFGDNP